MPGMQSTSTPQQRPEQRPEPWAEQRDLSASRNGPIEAAMRSTEARKDNPGSLAGSHSDTDGRPGWLRRWAGESRRDTDLQAAPEGQNPERGQGPQSENPAVHPQQDSAAVRGTDAVAGPSNGHTGHSIEAAFDFETVFHFETDLEAESTDDWLDLSGEGPHLAVKEDSRALDTSSLADLKHGSEHASNPDVLLNEPAAGDRTATSPDPKAVRAAIFRLAQQSPGGQIAKLISGDTPERGAERLTSMTPDGGFAEVARRVWGGTGTDTQISPESGPVGSYGRIGELSSSARAGRDQASHPPYEDQQVGSDPDQRTEAPGGSGAPEAQEYRADSVASGTIQPANIDPSQNIFMEQEATAFEPDSGQDSGNAPAGRNAVEPEHTTMEAHSTVEGDLSHYALADPRRADAAATRQDESASTLSDFGGPLESRQDHAEAAAQASLSQGGAIEAQARNGTPREAVQDHGQAQDRAGGGPALAHDAGNLLSALKLYSELLALSGVLHARHKHYAEDLKLLASRSEALIDRLLASCNLAERQAQRLLQESANRDVADAAAAVSGLPSTYSGQSEQPLSAGQLASEPILSIDHVDNGPRIERSIETGTETGERGNASFVGAPERTYAIVGQPCEPAHADADGPVSRELQEFASIGARPALGLTEDEAGDAAKSEAHGPSPVNLVDLLTRWGSLLSMIARGSVQVKFGSQAALPVRVAEEALERILVNLVHNAMTATRGGGAIRIGVGRAETRRSPHNEVRARPGNRMVLTVDDSGCGMTEEQIAKALGQDELSYPQTGTTAGNIGAAQIQDPANSAASNGLRAVSNADIRATRGLGLQIVRELVAASGGELAIFSRRGVGTRVEIQWPTAEPASGLERIPPASVGAVEAGSRGNYAGGRSQHLAAAFNDDAAESPGNGSVPAYGRNTQQRLNVALEGAVAC